MKLGISKPRTQEYRPRPIDGKATKAARTRHAAGVQRLYSLCWLGRGDAYRKAPPIPAPGNRAPAPIDPEAARARRIRTRSWLTFRSSHGSKLRIRRGVRVGQSAPGSVVKEVGSLNRRERRAATVVADRRIIRAQMPSVTAGERKRKRKAQRQARKANR